MNIAPAHAATAARNIGLKAARRALRLHKPVVRAVRRAQRASEHLRHYAQERQVEREIALAARGTAPIVVGPWLGEVGYEALYWIPFLRWFEDAFRIDPERVVAISRGGVQQWYAGLAGRYVDLFDFFTPQEFSERNAARRRDIEGGGQKQSGLGAFDREILSRVGPGLGARFTVFHPALLFRLFNQFWLGNRPIDHVWQHTRFERFEPAPSPGLDLPAEYVAAKFYTGTALPDSDATRRQLRTFVERVAQRTPVVMLDAGFSVDEHREYLFDGIPNVQALGGLAPRLNLGVQTQVIAHARQFIGTCGSLAWMAPMMGVPTIATHADDRLLTPHLLVARHAYRATGAARFTVLDLRAADHLRLLDPAPR